ncbi:hypothetical protein [Hirschia litorea]|uniref:Uncharacterized protein n=1 Tax=Hirschia litorea TaxID=1199156 RepID=A0ABW2IJY8_9PROT
MSQIVGRFVIISLLIAAVLTGLALLFMQQPGVRLSKFEQAQVNRFADAKPETPPLDAIVVTPCAQGACLLVQVAGRDFVIGAAQGAADGLLSHGLLSGKLDGVILTDLASEQIEGLTGLRDRSLEAGRKELLKVYGPSGVERVVEGLNAMLETSDVDRSVRFGQGVLPFEVAPAEAIIVDEDPTTQKFIDTGVLQIYAIPVQSTVMGNELLYRFDYEGQTLIIGGCGARLGDVKAALDVAGVETQGEAVNPVLVLPAASPEQLEIIRTQAKNAGFIRESRFATVPADKCLTAKGLANVQSNIGANLAIATPLFPAPVSLAEVRIWENEIRSAKGKSETELEIGRVWASRTLEK